MSATILTSSSFVGHALLILCTYPVSRLLGSFARCFVDSAELPSCFRGCLEQQLLTDLTCIIPRLLGSHVFITTSRALCAKKKEVGKRRKKEFEKLVRGKLSKSGDLQSRHLRKFLKFQICLTVGSNMYCRIASKCVASREGRRPSCPLHLCFFRTRPSVPPTLTG